MERPKRCRRLALLGAGGMMMALAPTVVLTGSSQAATRRHHAVSATQASINWVKRNIPGFPTSLVRQACREGQVMYYALPGTGTAAVSARFPKNIPCLTISTYKAPGGQLTAKFQAEYQAHQYKADVMQNTSPVYLRSLNAEGALGNWVPPNADLVPAWLKQKGLWYVTSGNLLTVIWNTKSVDPQQQKALASIKTWKDFLKVPGLQGKVTVIDIHGGGSDQQPWYFFYSHYGAKFAQQLKDKFQPVLSHGIIPSSEQLASGGTSVIFASIESIPASYYVQGAPLQWVFPKPYLYAPNYISITAHAPHKAAAKLLEAWLLSKQGQAAYVNGGENPPLSSLVPDRRPFAKKGWYDLPSLKDAFRPNWATINKDLPSLTNKFEAVFGS